MNSAASRLSVFTALLVATAASADINVVDREDAQLRIGGMAQLLGFVQKVNDPFSSDYRSYIYLQRARLRANGRYQDIGFNLELALGGEELVAAPSPGVSLGLLDLNVDIPVRALNATVRVGQFKVPYGRERLAYSGNLFFIDRSMHDLGFKVGRDVGVALTARAGKGTFIAGLFTGGGRDVPARYLPQNAGIPLLVARAGIGTLDEDPYALKQVGHEREGYALFVNALYTRDTTLGHSSALSVKMADKSLLLDPTWNPYIGRQPLRSGAWWQVGMDAALHRALSGAWKASGEAEINWAGYQNSYGVLHTAGGRAQAALANERFAVALRYSVLFPDAGFRNGTTAITGTQPIQEVTPALTYFLRGNDLKLVADLPILVNVPVFVEPNLGSYVASEQPAQAALLSRGGSVSRQNVVEGRLMLQARF